MSEEAEAVFHTYMATCHVACRQICRLCFMQRELITRQLTGLYRIRFIFLLSVWITWALLPPALPSAAME
ncbi:hypothetical protein MKC55_21200 [[Clostridium] innocuum]|uniref:Uncharacterized protein n=2 Tax=Clostridium innocuum TaxID=1522 RepID=A0AAP9SF00_CLOIN|nr:hypothetical protein [[Clostridium] innocuum]MCQ5280618.1 hypothetical protein [Clostridium sp. DFI.1.208]EHJ7846484.1 hypothetical protein [[Clostridium] innocuum]MBS9795797.1 hypothetical protein [[Clostridium] innocuum]MBU9116882.1 hypothetical protein [[Clostridium] innocuum]MBV4071242.1 hypothetical protein [[Clostridium] innocuum]